MREDSNTKLEKLKLDFYELRDGDIGKKRIKKLLAPFEHHMEQYLSLWIAFSKEARHVYPSQGLLITPHDYITFQSMQMIPQEKIVETLRMRRFFLEMFNHPYRVHFLLEENRKKFEAPEKIKCSAVEEAIEDGLAFSIGDLGASVVGSTRPRVSRKDRYAKGPFVKLGRQARGIFVGSASPDVWNSAAAISTMAASHYLCCIPRNGVTSDVTRQVDLAREALEWLKRTRDEILSDRKDQNIIYKMWTRNIMGTLSANPDRDISYAEKLFNVGVRTFRVYSPEPGSGPEDTVKGLRKHFSDEIEIFAGQVVDTQQAKRIEEAGADGIYIGIGGGGRCTTGVRSGSAIDWPALLWSMRGEVRIPVVVEGGASDHIATTLLLGASGIGVSRAASGGTIESPGGALYCVDHEGRLFKPYGGEASARTKYLDGKLMPFDIPAFVEGETTKAEMSYVKFAQPTITYNMHLLNEDAILALVFRNVNDVHELQNINPSPLRMITQEGSTLQHAH